MIRIEILGYFRILIPHLLLTNGEMMVTAIILKLQRLPINRSKIYHFQSNTVGTILFTSLLATDSGLEKPPHAMKELLTII